MCTCVLYVEAVNRIFRHVDSICEFAAIYHYRVKCYRPFSPLQRP